MLFVSSFLDDFSDIPRAVCSTRTPCAVRRSTSCVKQASEETNKQRNHEKLVFYMSDGKEGLSDGRSWRMDGDLELPADSLGSPFH